MYILNSPLMICNKCNKKIPRKGVVRLSSRWMQSSFNRLQIILFLFSLAERVEVVVNAFWFERSQEDNWDIDLNSLKGDSIHAAISICFDVYQAGGVKSYREVSVIKWNKNIL